MTVTQPTPSLDGGVASQALSRHMNAPVGLARTTNCLRQTPVQTPAADFYYSFVFSPLWMYHVVWQRLRDFQVRNISTLCRTSALSQRCLFIQPEKLQNGDDLNPFQLLLGIKAQPKIFVTVSSARLALTFFNREN